LIPKKKDGRIYVLNSSTTLVLVYWIEALQGEVELEESASNFLKLNAKSDNKDNCK